MNDLTDPEITLCFSIAGLPRGGTAQILTSLTHYPPSLAPIWSPTYTTGDFTKVVALLNTTLAGLVQSDVDYLRANVFSVWTQIVVSEMEITASGTDTGTLIKTSRQRELIRDEFYRTTGFAIPYGGFTEDAKRNYSIVKDKMGSGDR